MFNIKKAQSVGLITGLIFGIASLVIGVIIAFVIVSTLTGADLLTEGRHTATVINETGWLNGTGYQLTGLNANYVPGQIVITSIHNETGWGNTPGVFTLTNATVNSTGFVINLTAIVSDRTNFTYTNAIYSNEEISSTALSANFTKGVDNVSGKIPTILLIAAIVLILGVLVLLVGAWQRMRIGGGGI